MFYNAWLVKILILLSALELCMSVRLGAVKSHFVRWVKESRNHLRHPNVCYIRKHQKVEAYSNVCYMRKHQKIEADPDVCYMWKHQKVVADPSVCYIRNHQKVISSRAMIIRFNVLQQ